MRWLLIVALFCLAFLPAASWQTVANRNELSAGAVDAGQDWYRGDWLRMQPLRPEGYVCRRTPMPLTIDGQAKEPAWEHAPWTAPFGDIVGPSKPKPRFLTRAKMLWDDEFFYVFADLEEPHVWGKLTKKNEIIFYDNDFEVFIDPDGDTHRYYEFEMNALNTIWELTLGKPYMDGGPATHGTNLPGLKSAVHVRGTLNKAGDTDKGWSLEIAFPWKDLAKYAHDLACPPRDADQWRVNFSRVEWLVDIVDGEYRKIPREAHPEDNWVWSPQGLVNMHRPERWGYVQFSSAASDTSPPPASMPDESLAARDALMNVYHRQRAFKEQHKRYAESLAKLSIDNARQDFSEPLSLQPTKDGYLAHVGVKTRDGKLKRLQLRQDSQLTEAR